jgi:DNA invertase Pin-like site-specific DNA recombinase
MDGRFIAYYRASTDRQGRSGLGLPAQRDAVSAFLDGGNWQLVGEFTEVESGKINSRPQLAKALAACRVRAATLVVAKLDRLARNARFLLSIVEGTGDGGVVFCDLPALPPGPVGKFMVTQMAAVAELEAGLISQRTKEALAQAKSRGKILGGYRGGPKIDSSIGRAAIQKAAQARASELAPMIREMQDRGLSLRQMAAELIKNGVQTPRGGVWSADAVRRVIARTGQASTSLP